MNKVLPGFFLVKEEPSKEKTCISNKKRKLHNSFTKKGRPLYNNAKGLSSSLILKLKATNAERCS